MCTRTVPNESATDRPSTHAETRDTAELWPAVARGMHLFATSDARQFLELGKAAAITEVAPRPPRRAESEAPAQSP